MVVTVFWPPGQRNQGEHCNGQIGHSWSGRSSHFRGDPNCHHSGDHSCHHRVGCISYKVAIAVVATAVPTVPTEVGHHRSRLTGCHMGGCSGHHKVAAVCIAEVAREVTVIDQEVRRLFFELVRRFHQEAKRTSMMAEAVTNEVIQQFSWCFGEFPYPTYTYYFGLLVKNT